jgi:hypothetical protein
MNFCFGLRVNSLTNTYDPEWGRTKKKNPKSASEKNIEKYTEKNPGP